MNTGASRRAADSGFSRRILRGANVFSERSVLCGDIDAARFPAGAKARDLAHITAVLGKFGLATDPLPQAAPARLVEDICERLRRGLGLDPHRIANHPESGMTFATPLDPEALTSGIATFALIVVMAVPVNSEQFETFFASLRAEAERLTGDIQAMALERACRERQIPFRRLRWSPKLHQIGMGARQTRLSLTDTSRTARIATAIASDKVETARLLARHGVPVPRQVPIKRAADAWEAAQRIGLPVVVKPRFGRKGHNVSVRLSERGAIEAAAAMALQEEKGRALVETYIPGLDYRVLVAFGEVLAVAERTPAHVVGDGGSTVRALITAENARRVTTILDPIVIDAESLRLLAEEGQSMDSVPADGRRLFLKRAANRSAGGTCRDVTEAIDAGTARMLIRAAELVGLDVAGIDYLCPDISRPLAEVGGGICEINSRSGLRVHMAAETGTEKSIAGRFVDALVKAQRVGRIPVIVLLETAAAVFAPALADLLRRDHGLRIGLASGGTVVADGLQPQSRDGLSTAFDILWEDPGVDVIIAETSLTALLESGLGATHADLAVFAPGDLERAGEVGAAAQKVLERAGAELIACASAEAVVAAARLRGFIPANGKSAASAYLAG